MDKLNVCKVVGLEGFVNSGKSGVLKLLNKELLNINGSKVLHVFDCCGNECATKDISYNDDIIVVVEVNGKKIVVVSGGDYLSTPDIVIEIINGLSIHGDVLFVGMRYIYPAVGNKYKDVFARYGIKVESVFKPGFKRTSELPEGVLECAEEMWVRLLLDKAGISVQY